MFLSVLQNGPAYCEAFLNVLRNVTKEEAVQYVLALIDDMLSGTHSNDHAALMPHHARQVSLPGLSLVSLCSGV